MKEVDVRRSYVEAEERRKNEAVEVRRGGRMRE